MPMPATVPSIQTPQSLDAVRLEVETIASRIAAAMASMKTHGFAELRIESGKANLMSGMNRVHHFVQVVEDTIRERMRGQILVLSSAKTAAIKCRSVRTKGVPRGGAATEAREAAPASRAGTCPAAPRKARRFFHARCRHPPECDSGVSDQAQDGPSRTSRTIADPKPREDQG